MVQRHLATVVCGLRGHVTPAAEVASVDGPLLLGIDLDREEASSNRWRMVRCLRCDAWLRVPQPEHPAAPGLPPPDELPVPRRGRALRAALVLRLIAIERGFHALAFASIAVVALLLRAELAGVDSWLQRLLSRLTSNQAGTGAAFNGGFIVREGNRLLHLRPSTLLLLFFVASAYAVLESVEAVGLWKERRWAEYLTCVATAGFLPYEIYELSKGVSAFKLIALIVNLIVLVYLVWAKRLFGLRRLHPGPSDDVQPGPMQLFGRDLPVSATAPASLSSSEEPEPVRPVRT
jgi:uncharacterized membrane protein (DUF2068 family)